MLRRKETDPAGKMLFCAETGLRTGLLELLPVRRATGWPTERQTGASLYCLTQYLYFPKQWYKRDYTHTHTNVDVLKSEDSLRVARSSHSHFSHLIQSLPTAERIEEKQTHCQAPPDCHATFPKSRPVANHTCSPYPDFSLRGEKAALKQLHDASSCCRAYAHTLNEDVDSGAVSAPPG